MLKSHLQISWYSDATAPPQESAYSRTDHLQKDRCKFHGRGHFVAPVTHSLKLQFNSTIYTQLCLNFSLPFSPLIHPNALGRAKEDQSNTDKRTSSLMRVFGLRREKQCILGKHIQITHRNNVAQNRRHAYAFSLNTDTVDVTAIGHAAPYRRPDKFRNVPGPRPHSSTNESSHPSSPPAPS